jgi:hypothetical protein
MLFCSMDPPPILQPHEKPDATEFAGLALSLVRELAEQQPELAELARARGLELDA